MESENQWYEELFHLNPEAILLFQDRFGTILDANEAAARLYGYSTAELRTKSFSSLFHQESQGDVDHVLQSVVEKTQTSLKTRHVSKTGESIDVLITLFWLPSKSRTYAAQIRPTDGHRDSKTIAPDEQKFESLIRNSEDLIIISDRGGCITYVSPAFCRVTGFSFEEAIQQSADTLLHPDEQQASQELASQLREGATLVTKNRIKCKNGSYLWAEGTVTNLLHDQAVQGIVRNYRDISERVEVEKKIRQTKANLRAVFDSAVEGFIVTDPDLNILAFNNMARSLIFDDAIRTELESGRNLFDYIEPRRRNFFQEVIERVKKGEVVQYERNHNAHQGSRWLHYAIYPVTEGSVISGICVVGRDNTDTVNAKNQLKNSEHLYKTLVQEGSDLINIIDFEGNYKYLSQSLNSVLYSKAAEFVGKNAFDFVHPDDRETLKKEFEALRTVKRAKSTPYRFHIGSGEYRWLETVATNLMDEPGIEGIVINSRDVTETINNLQAIQKQNKLLQDIAWLQAHKVRAPLASILGLVNLFSLDLTRKELEESITMLQKSALELDEIVREIIKRSDGLDHEIPR